jgi:hypothetical protein
MELLDSGLEGGVVADGAHFASPAPCRTPKPGFDPETDRNCFTCRPAHLGWKKTLTGPARPRPVRRAVRSRCALTSTGVGLRQSATACRPEQISSASIQWSRS